jgi:predicted outer membrane repeat protein
MIEPVRRRRRQSVQTRLSLQRLEERATPATFVVSNINDSGSGSLRAALDLANANADADLINFDASVFNVPRTINLANSSGELSVTNSVTINGPGANLLTVRRISGATNLFRVFDILRNAYSIDVTLSGMTITGGALLGPGTAGDGAGVFVGDENVTLRDCIVTGNTTAAGDGAGVFVFSYGQLNLVNTTVSGNTVTTVAGESGDGGGIAGGKYVEIKVTNSTIAGNSAGGHGGGVALVLGGSLVVANSTISGNIAGVRGGGVYFYGPSIGPGAVFRNSTIANNSTAGEGGGIAVVGGVGAAAANLVLQNSTVAGNTGRSGGGGVTAGGGGIGFISGAGSITLAGTVVANNADLGTSSAPDLYSINPVDASFSLVRNQTGAAYPNYVTQNNLAAGTDPLFAAAGLINNGGPINTIALQPTSPLINTGINAATVGVDARGHGFPRTIGVATDIGAFEFASTAPSAAGSQPDGTIPDLTAALIAGNGYTYQFAIVYAGSTPINLGTLGTGDVSVTGPSGFTQVATFISQTTTGNQTKATYQIIAPGNFFDATDYGSHVVSVNANQVQQNAGGFVPAGAASSFRILSSRTFTVVNTNDAGPGSLRQAILDANARIDTPDSIVFDPATFSTAAPQTITLTLASGQLDVFDPLTITGPGSNRLTISGGNAVRILRIQMPGVGAATITGVRLTAGNADGAVATNDGNGGAIWMSNDALTLDGVVISNSQTNRQGGGIGVGRSGSLTIRNSTISGNTVVAGGPYSSGGGVYFRSGGQLFMENCTVSGNSAITQGGGIYMFGDVSGSPNGMTIRNTTISGNAVTNSNGNYAANGGGIGLYFVYGPVLLQNCTITANTVAGTSPLHGGGGISARVGNPTITAVSTVIAQNTSAISPDVLGTLNISNGLIGSAAGATLPNYGTQNNLPLGTNPLFVGGGPAANGGPVNTIALQPTSPLLNVGANPAGLGTDARGGPFVRNSGGVDIGAFELQTVRPPRVASTVVNDGSVQRSMVTSLTITFNTNVNFGGAPAAAFSLTRNGGGAVNFALTLTTLGGATVATLTNFTGTESQNGSLRDGRYTLTVNAAQVSSLGGALDGNGDGVGGDNYTFGDPQGLFRMFGDVTASRNVDIADFGLLSSTFNLARAQPGFNAAFDFNNDNTIDIADFGQFSLRIFTALP